MKLSEPQDEYIISEKLGQNLTGLYRVGQDENDNRKIDEKSSGVYKRMIAIEE